MVGSRAMNRSDLVLATLASAGLDAAFSPVQLQKIFFLLDRRAPKLLHGPHFNFQPYDYGPFDQTLYHELDVLQLSGLVRTDTSGRYRRYSLTPQGRAEGNAMLTRLPLSAREFVRQTVEWVRSLRFDQLVAAIYREYPEMKVNSVFSQ